MKYNHIFKTQYSTDTKRVLVNIIDTLNKDPNNIGPNKYLTALYLELTNLLLEHTKNGEFDKVQEFLQTQYEVEYNFRYAAIADKPNNAACINIFLNEDKKEIWDIFDESSKTTNVVENIYFDVLDDLINGITPEYLTKTNKLDKLDKLKNVIFNVLVETMKSYNTKLKEVVNILYPEPIIFVEKADIDKKIKQCNDEISRLETCIISIRNEYESCYQNLNKILNQKSEKQNLKQILLDIRRDPHITEAQKESIDNHIKTLENEIKKYLSEIDPIESLLYTKKTQYTDLISAQDLQYKKIDLLKNRLLYRLNLIKDIEKHEIEIIASKKTYAILNNEQEKIRAYEIAKYHIQYTNKILEVYYYIISKYIVNITQETKNIKKRNNVEDIKVINNVSLDMFNRFKQNDPKLNENDDIAKVIFTILTYTSIYSNKNINWKDKFSFWDDYKEYISYYKSFSPIEVNEAKPNGFYSFTQFKRRDKFNSQSNFNDQFNNYRKKFSAYDASVIISEIIKLGDTGLTEEELINPIKYSLYFNEDNGVGGVMFFKLYNDNWLVFSLMGMAFKIKKYTEIEVEKYPAFRDMTSIYTNSFLREAEVALPAVYSDGRPSYVSKNNRQIYPTAELAFTSQDSSTNVAGNKKVANYDNYFKFWEDFYGSKEVVTASIFYDKVRKNVIGNQGKDLFKALKDILQDTLHRYAEACKTSMDESGWLHKAATIVVPFYDVVYKLNTDSEYELTDMDIVSLIIDSVCILFIAAGASIKLAGTTTKSIMHSVIKARTLGITGRKNLLIYAARNTSGLPKEVALILIKSAFDVVNPIPFTSLPTRFPRVSKLLKTGFSFKSGDKTLTLSKSSRAGELKPEWAVNNRVMDLSENTKIPNGDLKNVYATTPDSPYTLADKDYYIKEGGKVYQVEWDDYSHTLRVIDQRNPGLFSYKTPVKWDNGANKWITHSFVPGLGGNPGKTYISREKLSGITKSQAEPMIILLEEVRRDALHKITVIKNALKNPTEEQEEYINKAFDIFMGHHGDNMKNALKYNIEEQYKNLTNLNVYKDITYVSVSVGCFSKALMSTINSKPFFIVHFDNIINFIDNNRTHFKQFLPFALMHELHHHIHNHTATPNHKVDHAYATQYIDKIDNANYPFAIRSNRIVLDQILSLPNPDFRKGKIEYLFRDEHFLQYLSDNYKKHEKEYIITQMMQSLNLRKNNNLIESEKIISDLTDKINKYSEELDKKVLENPDNTVYLLSLLYYLFEKKEFFTKFVKNYDEWFTDPKKPCLSDLIKFIQNNKQYEWFIDKRESCFWEFIDIPNEETLSLKKSYTGKLSSGDIKPLRTKKGLITSITNEEIDISINDIKFSTFNLNRGILLNKASNLFENKKTKFEESIITWKGLQTSVLNSVNRMPVNMNNIVINNRVNFIKIFNATDKVVGIGINLRKITHINPLIISSDTLGCSTMIHAVKDDHFYAYYSDKDIDNSITGIIALHSELNNISSPTLEVNNQSSLAYLSKVFNDYYDKSVINYYASQNIPTPTDPKVNLWQYNAVSGSSNYIRVGQSYALLVCDQSLMRLVKSYSQNYSLVKNNNNTLDMVLDSDKEFELKTIRIENKST